MLAARGQMLIASQSALLWGSFIIGVPKGMRIATSGFALLTISPKKTTERK